MNPSRRITIILASIATVCGALGVAQKLGLGDGYSLLEAAAVDTDATVMSQLDHDVFRLPSWGEYAAVLEHPVFNESREPTPVEASQEGAEGGEGATAQPINVTLTSIIISPKVKLAIVRDNNTGQSVVIKVGSALEGEQSGWKLVEVGPRLAVFEGQGLGRQELELSVDASAKAALPPSPLGLPGGLPPPMQTKEGANPDMAAPDANNQVKAEEIRMRIEERRKQLREEAERMRAQENKQ